LDYALFDDMPPGWRHPVTGRKQAGDDPALEQLGIYLRRARYIAGLSQQKVADAAHVPQAVISRLERALAPAMNVERLAWIERALDGAFPVGYCPHEHVCRWVRLKPRPTAEEEWAAEVEKQLRLTEQFYGNGRNADLLNAKPEPKVGADSEPSLDDEAEADAFLASLLNE
jgi:transcriptional regulator with XRE-family HTH domain